MCKADPNRLIGGTVKSFLSKGLLLAGLSAGCLLWGQNASTSLHGVVKDPTGAVLPGAKVTLTN